MNLTCTDWERSDADVFWTAIAPNDHVVQIYDNQAVFLDSLAGFVGGGINSGDCVIVIATRSHLDALEYRLKNWGIYINTLIEDERYIPVEAEKTLSEFMVDGWPDERLFMNTVSRLIGKGDGRNRKIRAFGEMVALLWANGDTGATIQLEQLWNKFCEKHNFSLFCAYPKSGFNEDADKSIGHICNCHAKIINGSESSVTQVLYKNSN